MRSERSSPLRDVVLTAVRHVQVESASVPARRLPQGGLHRPVTRIEEEMKHGKQRKAEGIPEMQLRAYAGPWEGQLVLACGKCQRKLKGSKASRAVARLKKSLAKISRGQGGAVTVLKVSCLQLCPKGGVTVCFGRQVERGECSIVRTREDLETLCGQLLPRVASAIQVHAAGVPGEGPPEIDLLRSQQE